MTRRNTTFLKSIDFSVLDGDGYAFTLTMRDIPGSAEAYAAVVKRLMDRLNLTDMIRWHRVMELTRRRVPHLHGSVYFPEGWLPPGATADKVHSLSVRQALVARWIAEQWSEVAGEYGVTGAGQMVKAIDGPEGWAQYVAKHADRGVRHYQRQGMPPGWDSMPQVWSKGGDWPVGPSMDLDIDSGPAYWRFRRLVRGWLAAQRRTELRRAVAYGDQEQAARARRSLGWVKRSQKCTNRGLSAVRGRSDWGSPEVVMQLAAAAGWTGEMKAVTA